MHQTEIYIKNIYFNPPYTIVIFADGTKTISKCGETDTYDKVQGVANCFLKKLSGDHYYSDISKLIAKIEARNEKIKLAKEKQKKAKKTRK